MLLKIVYLFRFYISKLQQKETHSLLLSKAHYLMLRGKEDNQRNR